MLKEPQQDLLLTSGLATKAAGDWGVVICGKAPINRITEEQEQLNQKLLI
jgi:hypothetical protein